MYEKLIQNIESLSQKKGINKTTALIESGAGKNFIYNISKGSDPSNEKIQQLATYFSVSTDYLLGRTDNPNIEVDGDLQRIIDVYRDLNNEGRKALSDYVEFISAKVEYKKSPASQRNAV